jgi:hypothetical protein
LGGCGLDKRGSGAAGRKENKRDLLSGAKVDP